jgi:hypothetical protein
MQDAAWESIAHSRTDVLKLLRKYGGILDPFLTKDLLGAALEDQFVRIRDYMESDDSSALHSYERAKTGLASYGQQAREFRTKYSSILCERLSTILFTICERKFEQSGAGRPARIVAKPFDKKYPFHSSAHPINIRFSIENLGSGYARDVSCSITTEGSATTKRPELFLGNLGIDKIAVEFPVELCQPVPSLVVDLAWNWLNFDGSSGQNPGCLSCSANKAMSIGINLAKKSHINLGNKYLD